MPGETVVEEFRAKVAADMDAVITFIVNGKCKSYEDYKGRCHELYAYKRATDHFNEAVTRVYEEPDGDQDE